MGTEILKSFGNLQSELEQAKSSLRGVDENIKRLIGRDPSEGPLRPGFLKRTASQNTQQEQRAGRNAANRKVFSYENEEPPTKRRSVFSRLSDKISYDDDDKANRGVISKVIVTRREVPSRLEALEAQSKDVKSKERNRRMFGALLGTLQKFRQEETKLKPIEDKRAQVEKKIEETEIKEKEEIKKERKELFFNRKKKQAEIKMIELKMNRLKDFAKWEDVQKSRKHFIKTRSKPHVYYLPKKLNEECKKKLEDSRDEIEKMIEERRKELMEDLQQIEEKMKKNFEPKNASEDKIDDIHEDFEDGDVTMLSIHESEDVTKSETENISPSKTDENTTESTNQTQENDTPEPKTESEPPAPGTEDD